MIARVLDQCKSLNYVVSAGRKTRHLTWQDIHPLQVFTDVLSGEESVSVSYLKSVLHLLRTNQDDTDLTRAINKIPQEKI